MLWVVGTFFAWAALGAVLGEVLLPEATVMAAGYPEVLGAMAGVGLAFLARVAPVGPRVKVYLATAGAGFVTGWLIGVWTAAPVLGLAD